MSKKSHRQIAAALLGTAMAFASPLAFAQSAGDGRSASNAPAPHRDGLAAMLARAGDGSVRVIFTLSMAATDPASRTPAAAADFDGPAAAMEAGKGRLAAAMRGAGVAQFKPVAGLPMIAANVNAMQLTSLAQSGLVARYEEDLVLSPSLAQSVPLIGAPSFWTGPNIKGQGQIVAIIDTGVMANHNFLNGRLASEACFSTTSATYGSTAVCTSGSTAPGAGAPCLVTKCNHGTHVAGIAVGRSNGTATYNGVAPEARFMAIQAASNFSGVARFFSSDILAALQHVKARKLTGVKVAAINLSFGASSFTAPCNPDSAETLIAQLKALNVATVVASGNDGFADKMPWPACAPSAIAVGASSKTDVLWPLSNSSSMIDLLAPGVAIQSSVSSSSSAYAADSGTSMAAPHVAGAFALLRQAFPCYPHAVIEADLKSTGVSIAHPSNGQTYKRINLAAARNLLRTRVQYACTLGPANTGDFGGPR